MQTFGQYTISFHPPEVRHGRRLLRLAPKQFHVLAMLVRARGRTVEKEKFFETVWKGRAVEEANLSQTVFLIRRALGKLANGKDYIETIPGQGYRLAADAVFPPPRAEHASRQTEASLAERLPGNLDFRLLVEAIEDYAIYLLDCAGRVLTWNRGADLNKGFTREEVLGQHYSMFFVPEDVDARAPDKELATATTSGRCSGEGWRIKRNGERYWASFALTAVRNESGKLLGYAKIIRDISHHRRQEDSFLRLEAGLRRERDRLRAVADSSLDAVYICEAVRDQNGEIEDFIFSYLNENVENIVSIPRDKLLGGRMCDLFPLSRPTGLFETYKQVVLTGKSFAGEVFVEDENLKTNWVKVRAVRLEDGVVITASDISALKIAEQRLLQSDA
jgi:PAS domain S-box-containing protein